MSAPGTEVELEITDVAFGGQGVARHEGKVYFVPFVIPGERVRARVTRGRKKFVEAELVEVLQASPERVEPACPYFGRCGGCAYQHLAYPQQLALKQRQVEQTLRRVGKLADVPMRPAIASPLAYEYRNRIRVHVDERAAGFYAWRSHRLIDIEVCPIAAPPVNAALNDLRSTPVPPGDYILSARGRGAFFEQTNNEVAALLVETVRAALRPGQELLVDAYSGAGFFAHRLADLVPRVIGIEENVSAVEHARRHAASHETYVAGDVAQHLGEVLAAATPERTTIILDPPAAGISPRVAEMLLIRPAAQILYVSCDPATLGRDLGVLCQSSYRLEAVTALDMFPQTAEVEVFAQLAAS